VTKTKEQAWAARTLDTLSRAPLRIEEIFGIVFNNKQYEHYQGVRTFVGFPKGDLTQYQVDKAREWLANSNRGEGRTTILAMCFLEWSVTRPGLRVDYFDHYAAAGRQEAMRKVLQDLVEKNPTFKAHVEFIRDQAAFRFTPFEGN
jgi:hypothetical protein